MYVSSALRFSRLAQAAARSRRGRWAGVGVTTFLAAGFILVVVIGFTGAGGTAFLVAGFAFAEPAGFAGAGVTASFAARFAFVAGFGPTDAGVTALSVAGFAFVTRARGVGAIGWAAGLADVRRTLVGFIAAGFVAV